MDKNEILSIVFKPVQNIVGAVLTSVGVVEFFIPGLQSRLTWPAISQSIPWYGWLSVGLFIWIIGILIESLRHFSKKAKASSTSPLAESRSQSGGVTVGKADTINYYEAGRSTGAAPRADSEPVKSEEELAPEDYRIEPTLVLDDPFTNHGKVLNKLAGVLVENVGEGKIQCVARLMRIERIEERGEDQKIREPVRIADVNPRGYYLRWDNGQNGCILNKHQARRIDFANAYERGDFHRYGNVLFEKEYSKPIRTGVYSVQIDILRVARGGEHTKMASVNGSLGVLLYFSRSPSPLSGEGIYVKWIED